MIHIREAIKTDLEELLHLYEQLHCNPFPGLTVEVTNLWETILADGNHHIIVASKGDRILSSCVLIIIPNLTHNQRPYALIENVITDENHRNKGYSTLCLNFAREIAKQNYCYKIMLLTGSKSDSTLRFYEKAGYNKNDKTAFIQWI